LTDKGERRKDLKRRLNGIRRENSKYSEKNLLYLPLSPPHITSPTITSGLRCKIPGNTATDMPASLSFKLLNEVIMNTLWTRRCQQYLQIVALQDALS